MITVLTDKYGKISAGTSIPEKGKNKSSLALRPFTRGRYELFKGRDSYNINGAETIESFYAIGEDVDKYMAASYVLELTDKMIDEEQPVNTVYRLLADFLKLMAGRRSSFGTVVIAFQVKALQALGLSISRNPLLAKENSDKINAINYFEKEPMESFAELALTEKLEKDLSEYVKRYISDNLGIANLKSEALMI